MRTTALAWPHGRTAAGSACSRHSRARALEDRLAAFGHDLPRRRTGCRTHRRRVYRTRSGLGHDEPARRRLRRLNRTRRRSCGRRCTLFARRRGGRSAGPRRWRKRRRRGKSSGRGGFCSRRLRYGNWRFQLGLENRGSAFNRGFAGGGGLRCRACLRLRRSRRRGRPRRNDDRRRRTRHRLRGNETWRGPGLGGGRGRRARSWSRGLGRNGRRRRNRGARRRRRDRTRRCSRLSHALRDRLQHIARLGDVREIDLRLELVAPGRWTRGTGGCALALLEIFLHALGFVFFDRAGVRFLFGDADLGENFEDLSALDLEFSRQIVNSNLVLHYAPFPPWLFPVCGYAFIASSWL